MLGRAGFLYTADGSTNPFRRGIFVRRELLCDHIDPPPRTSRRTPSRRRPWSPGRAAGTPSRRRSSSKPCASCHQQFSQLGYALEAYDGLARFRTEERLVTTQGEERGLADVDTSVVPFVELDDDRPTASAVELNQRLAESDKVDQCFAAHVFRFSYRRLESGQDSCFVNELSELVGQGVPLRDAFRALALHPHFRSRLLED